MSERTAKLYRKLHPELKGKVPQINQRIGATRRQLRYMKFKVIDRSFTATGKQVQIFDTKVAEDGRIISKTLKSQKKAIHKVNDAKKVPFLAGTNKERNFVRSVHRRVQKQERLEAARSV